MATASPRRARCFIEDLNSPFGMALVGDELYVANTDALVRFPYKPGETKISARGDEGRRPAGRAAQPSLDQEPHRQPPTARKLYVDGRLEQQRRRERHGARGEAARRSGRSTARAAQAASSPAGCATRSAWPGSRRQALWTSVNERDEIGSDLVPDYMTSVRDGGFYGWPYSYYGQHVDKRVEPPQPDLVAKAIEPDYALGPHTASLGLAFAQGEQPAGAVRAAACSSASTARGTASRPAATR